MCLGTWSQNRYRLNAGNVAKWRFNATESDIAQGRAWYREANRFVDSIVAETGIDARIVTAVLSALSPNNPWENNKRDCRRMVHAHVNGESLDSFKVSTFNSNKRKAWSFLRGHKWQNGPKTTAFVDNITRPEHSQLVTVDVWAARVAMDYSDFALTCPECTVAKGSKVVHGAGLTAKDYDNISAMYVQVAELYDELPLETQAICWVAMKNATGR